MPHEKIPRDVKRDIAQRDNVISVGWGRENGDDIAVVTVEMSSGLAPRDFPPTLGGHPVRVKYDGPPVLDQSFQDPHDYIRPVQPGTATQRANGSGGTISFLMTDGEQLYLSSNSHVWGVGGQKGDKLLQPTWADINFDDALNLTENEMHVANFVDATELDYGADEHTPPHPIADFAWGTVADGVSVTREVNGIGKPQGVRRPEPGDKVIKAGATTHISEGEVVEQEVTINWDEFAVEDVVKTTLDSDDGDSGSPVMHNDGSMDAAGVHFGRTWFQSVEANIDNCIQASGLDVVTADSQIPGENEPPTAVFNTTVDGLTVTADATPSSDPEDALETYQWAFGDGTMDSGKVVKHTYQTAGTYTIELTVTDAAGQSHTFTDTVNVSQGTSPIPPETPALDNPVVLAGIAGLSTVATVALFDG